MIVNPFFFTIMLNCITKDKKRRNLFKKFEIKTLQNKSISQDHLLLKNLIKVLSREKNEILLTKSEKKVQFEKDKIHFNKLHSFWIKKN